MGSARTRSVVLVGIDGVIVDVEVDIAQGLVTTAVVGLADRGVTEAKERVRAALNNSQESWPSSRVTISLAPAWIPKVGAVPDLAVALAMVAAQGRIRRSRIDGAVVLGELGLDGVVKGVRGVLPAILAARRAGLDRAIVPSESLDEALLVPGVEVIGVHTLAHAIAVLRGDDVSAEPRGTVVGSGAPSAEPKDLSDVVGQPLARRALELAAAGGHHLFLHGPPGVGKTMLAERLVGLLPRLTGDAALEVTAVHSVAGTLSSSSPLVTTPPFEAPHHTATFVALVGGGSGRPQPGAISRAHRGVLFLDEAPEFHRAVLDALREPIESGHVTIARSAFRTTFPAQFQLVLAANPCPCGAGDERGIGCRCTPMQRRRYAERISGPLLDRLDLVVATQPADRAAMLSQGARGESTAEVRARVDPAVERMRARLAPLGLFSNARVPGSLLRHEGPCGVAPDALALLRDAATRGRLSSRAIDKVLRVAWTITDLAGRDRPGVDEVAEAAGYRDESFRTAA
jgi:magnesium chelatase family protein